MGPYCKFCQTRCFESIMHKLPVNHRYWKLLGKVGLLATCPVGAHYDRAQLGINAYDVREAVAKLTPN